ncbi:MAG: bifunctional folylpolyglutamate synthase/dihydrofolate synthase [Candidatus Thalassarchaeum sp.]
MGMKLGLENCQILLSRLGDPHLEFPSIHVAGSNGKGSLCVQLSAAASASGLMTGLFTSPHLVTVEERIRINGRPITPDDFDRHLAKVRQVSEQQPECSPTYFETTFIAAMLAFSEAGVERGIIETGMGGRLDATRLVDADLCFLTTVSMEHSEFLGDSLQEIAFEKASIHRSGVPMIAMAHEDAMVRKTIEEIAGPDLRWWLNEAPTPWDGYTSMVREAAAILGWSSSSSKCVWPGRSPDFGQDWVEGILTRISAAHNAESLAKDLSQVDKKCVLMLGMTAKSNLSETLAPLASELRSNPLFQGLVLTQPISGRNRAVTIEELEETMSSLGISEPDATHENPMEAFSMATGMAADNGCNLMVIGSVYLVGDLFRYMVDIHGWDLWEVLTVH